MPVNENDSDRPSDQEQTPDDATTPSSYGEGPRLNGTAGHREPEPESAFDALPGPGSGTPPGHETDDTWMHASRGGFAGEPPLSNLPDAAAASSLDGEPEKGEMGFFDHLTELRSRIIKALLGLILGAILAAVFSDFIVNEILNRPAEVAGVKMIATGPMSQLTLTLQVSLISGLIISIPWIIWQFWQFVKPGLYEKEKKYSSWIAVATIFCFLAGVAFAYFVMIPSSLGFAAQFTYDQIQNMWSISEYFSFVLGFVLACGVIFEMPMLSFALARFGILTPAFMRHYRKHAAIVILIVSAIITPTPDPFNQLVLAVPLYGLFEISILVAAAASRKREKAYAEMFTDDDVENDAEGDVASGDTSAADPEGAADDR